MATTRIEPSRAARPERRPELDAMRTLVVVGLVFFHSALVFDSQRRLLRQERRDDRDHDHPRGALRDLGDAAARSSSPGWAPWHSMRRRGPGGFASGTIAAAGRAAGVRDAHDRAGAAVAAAAGRPGLRRVVPAVPAEVLLRAAGPERLPVRPARGRTSRPGTCGSWCCCWRSRCCWRRWRAGCRATAAGLGGRILRPRGGLLLLGLPVAVSARWWGWRRRSAAGAAGRTWCSSCTGSSSRPTPVSARRCGATGAGRRRGRRS